MGNSVPEAMSDAEVWTLFQSLLLNQPPPSLRELRCLQSAIWGAVLAVPTMHVILWLLGYSPNGVRRSSPAARIHSWEARRHGGEIPRGSTTANAQRAGTGKLSVTTWLQTALVMAGGAMGGIKHWQLKTSGQLPAMLVTLEETALVRMTLIQGWLRSAILSRM